MTVAERWYRVALLKAALEELAAHVPAIQHTKRELEQIRQLRWMVEQWVTNQAKDFPATFNLACIVLGADPSRVRQHLRI